MNEQEPIEILIVEDNPTDEELTLYALKESKVINRIFVVRDGQEAIDFIFCQGKYATRSPNHYPKVIFLDLKLPKLDGIEVLKRIKSDIRFHQIPIVMLTSSQEEKDLIDSYRLGVNSYIVKPVDFHKFVEAVQKLGMYWVLYNKQPAHLYVQSP